MSRSMRVISCLAVLWLPFLGGTSLGGENQADLVGKWVSGSNRGPKLARLSDIEEAARELLQDDPPDISEELPAPPAVEIAPGDEDEQTEGDDQLADELQDDDGGLLYHDDEASDDDDAIDDDYLSDDSEPVGGDFPALPPDPNAVEGEPTLFEELYQHGGSYLYSVEGDRWGVPSHDEAHFDYLRLPHDHQAPDPFTLFAEFQGADPIRPSHKTWRGPGAYTLEPRFVGYGGYELFGFALEQGGNRQDVIGHNLRVDLDLRLTGTERIHVQFRPFGRRNTGGSYYQFSEPDGFVNNFTGEPDRYWFEADLHSLLGWGLDRFAQRNLNITAGKFPYALHNTLLINDEIIGGVLSRNNIFIGKASQTNIQLFAGINDVDTYRFAETQVYGIHASVDYRKAFYEATYAYLNSEFKRDAHYAGLSRTKFYGPFSLALRGFYKFGDRGGTGSAHLAVIETNWTRVFEHAPFHIHHGVFFCNAFRASRGWNSIGGGNFNRLRTAFEVDPLVRLAAGPAANDTIGVAFGVQLFRNHEDESLIPEFAWEAPGGDSVFGFGLKYQRKLSKTSFLEIFGVKNWSDNQIFDREGIFVSRNWLF